MHDNPPPASGTPQLHDDGLEEFDSSYRWHNDLRVIEGSSSSSSSDLDSEAPPLHSETPPPLPSETPPILEAEAPQPLESEALPLAPETHTFFNDALKHKLVVYGSVGGIAAASVLLVLSVENLIKYYSPGSYVSAFLHPSLTNI